MADTAVLARWLRLTQPDRRQPGRRRSGGSVDAPLRRGVRRRAHPGPTPKAALGVRIARDVADTKGERP